MPRNIWTSGLLSCGFLMTLLVQGCHSQRYTATQLPPQQLVFGHGGGFTGSVTQYTLLENGQVFAVSSLSRENRELKSISRKRSQALFYRAEQLGLDTLTFNHPGNQYYFIGLKHGEEVRKVTWGSPGHPAPTQIQTLYQELSSLTQKP